jgi:hypothetical protein
MPGSKRYDVIACRVTAHAPYGLLIESLSGERGYVDDGEISDRPLKAKDWPAVGQVITGTVLAVLRDGRLVVSARSSDVTLSQSAADIGAAMSAWARLTEAGSEYQRAVDALVASGDARAVFNWALSRSRSTMPGIALQALANGPSGLLLDVLSGVIGLLADDQYVDEARRAISAAGLPAAEPALLQVVKSLLAESELTAAEYLRLVEALRNLDAERSREEVIDTMLRSDDPNIRAIASKVRGGGPGGAG